MQNMNTQQANSQPLDQESQWIFWASFVALVATAFGFIVRTQVINEWGTQFNLSETQKGEISVSFYLV